MKILKSFILLAVIVSLFSGCALFRNPIGAWNKVTGKAETATQQLDSNYHDINTAGKNYVYATHLALESDPSTNQYHQVESQLNDKALVVLGSPSMEYANQLQTMVNNLLSTNAASRKEGKKQLTALDNAVIDLQEENANLKEDLAQAQKKIVAVGTTNAAFASKWTTLMKFVWWGIYLFIGVTVLRIVSAVLPPPYNTIGAIVEVPVGLFVKFIHALVPKTQDVAGVVSKDYQIATDQLVQTIQALKDKHPELHTEISQTVFNNVDSTIAPTVNKSKSRLKLVT